jgi:hypothetical protein
VHCILAPQGELQLVAGRLGSAVSRQKPVNALQGPGQMNKGQTKKVVDAAKEAEKPLIRVTHGSSCKAIQLGDMENAPKGLARMILAEQVREALGHNEAED